MQSQSMLTVRTSIMLICMVLVPVLAVFGPSWSKLVSPPANPPRKLPTSESANKAPSNGASGYTSVLTQGPATARTSSAAPERLPATADLASSGPMPAARPSGLLPESPIKPAAASAPLWSAEAGALSPASNPPPRTALERPSSTKPSAEVPKPVAVATPSPPGTLPRVKIGGAHVPGAPPSRAPAARTGGVSATPAAPAATEWFSSIQQRLRDLGATYYLLETWGPGGGQYRFHCKMAVAGNTNNTRHFEATATDAAQAMQTVLQQVEAWQAGQQP